MKQSSRRSATINSKPRDIAAAILISFALFGVIEFFNEDVWIIHSILLALLGYAWCKTHAQDNGISEPPGSAVLVGILSIIGAATYFFRISPVPAAIRSSSLVLLFAVGCIAAYLIPTFLLEWLFIR